MNSLNTKQAIIALWFATAGFIPAVVAFTNFSEFTFQSYIMFLVLPIICAGISGYKIGYPIIQGESVQYEIPAILRGLLVSIVSYLLLCLAFVIIEGAISLINPGDLPRDLLSKIGFLIIELLSTILGLIIFFPIFFFGQFSLLLASGGIAGLLLFTHQANIKKLLLVGILLILPAGTYFLWHLPNPNNIPIYPNAKNIQYGNFETIDSGTAQEKIISFQTSDPFDQVLSYYEKQLREEGWSYSSNHFGDNTRMLEFYTLSKNYKVRIERNPDDENKRIEIRIWHSTPSLFQ